MTTTEFFYIDGRMVFGWPNAMTAQRWQEMREDIAEFLDENDTDDIGTVDVYWGGADNEDQTINVVTCRGDIVGSFDRPIAPSELPSVKDALVRRLVDSALTLVAEAAAEVEKRKGRL